ncbi:hypothetical protein [Nocardia sp. IFM 10818]
MERGNTKHGPARDDHLAHDLRDLLHGGHTAHIEEWRNPEPPADDDPALFADPHLTRPVPPPEPVPPEPHPDPVPPAPNPDPVPPDPNPRPSPVPPTPTPDPVPPYPPPTDPEPPQVG